VTVYYATQTGTAESFARQLEREAPDHGFFFRVKDMEDAALDQLVNSELKDPDTETCRVIVLAATYGEGEPTDNATAFVAALKGAIHSGAWVAADNGETKDDQSKDPAVSLEGLDFCVFGLGNRQYEHYNAMGKIFDEGFETLGGKRVCPIGLGDDDNDLEGDFESWKETLWSNLESHYIAKGTTFQRKQSTGEFLPDCDYAVEYHSPGTKPQEVPLEQVHGSSRHYFTSYDCPITTVRELRSSQDDGSTVHIEIDISQATGLSYETADNLGVLPVNDPQIVESVAQSLGYDLDAIFSLKAAPDHEWHGAPFPMPITIRECLTRYCDLTSAPRRSDLKHLTAYAQDAVDRQCLTRLSSKEGKKEYKEKITEGYVGMVDLLKLCPSLSIPLEHFVSVCHLLLPRFYTIASSSSVHPKSVHLSSVVTKEKKTDGTLFHGVCSTHLAMLQPGNHTVRVFNRPSTFRLPTDTKRPIIMIGPGTGIAPMRALLQERQYQKTIEKQTIGLNVLYFGCKARNLDYLYQVELEKFQTDGILDQIHLAFSREQTKKVYVQHLLSQNAKETWNLLDHEKAHVYVCGGVKMGHDVTEAIKETLVAEGQMSFDAAKVYLAKMASEGRFVQELWA
jgi:NADPH-ferrihemoprotein reductase